MRNDWKERERTERRERDQRARGKEIGKVKRQIAV